MDNDLRAKLAQLAVAIGEVKRASMFDKAAKADHALAAAVDLLGALVDFVETIGKAKR
jgi:hypothetical protein